jgi:hypothetical protein
MKRLMMYISIVLFWGEVQAQELDVVMMMDTTEARIGEPLRIDMLASALNDAQINWPIFQDHLKELEILSESKIDTQAQGQLNLYKKSIQITAWDSGYYIFGPFPFTENGDTVMSDAAFITYHTIEELGEGPLDIRPPVDMPLTFGEWMKRYGWYVLGGLILLAALIYFLLLSRKDKETAKEAVPSIPAFEEAMNSMDELKSRELWQAGAIKTYYAGLSFIYRRYLEREWQVDALEYTSSELDREMMRRFPQEWARYDMVKVAQQADLAKFAKARHIAEDHDRNFENALGFMKIMNERMQQERKEAEHAD